MNIAEAETCRMFLLLEETAELLHIASRVPIFPSRQLMTQLRATESQDLPSAVEALWVLERAVSASRCTSPEKRQIKTPASIASHFSKDVFSGSSTQLAELRRIWHVPLALCSIQASTPLSAHSNEGLLEFAGCFDDLVSICRARTAKSNTEMQSLQDYIQRKEQFIEKTGQQIQLASSELARQREVRDNESSLAQETISKLSSDIEQIETGHAEELSALEANLSATTSQDKELNGARLKQTAETVTSEEAHLQKTTTQHRDAELEARKKKARLELELQTAIGNYDNQMLTASQRVQHAQSILSDVQGRIQKLKAYFAQKDVDDAAAKIEDARDRRERHAKSVLGHLREANAAHRIMRYYRLKVLAPRAAEAQLIKMKKKK